MKYVLTGSTGNITKPLAEALIAAGHEVTIISSNKSKQGEIETLGAKPAIGNILDTAFLTKTFSGADAVYLMVPPNFTVTDWFGFQKEVSDNFVKAIEQSGVKNIVQLSSIGAHMGEGAGPIDGLAYLEKALNSIAGINVVKLRPSYFFTNFFTMADMVKHAGILGSNMGNGDFKLILTHPKDIAAAATKNLLALDFKGQTIEYVSSDIRSFTDLVAVLGKAIGKPELPWIPFSDEEALQGMLQSGLPEVFAKGYVQMGKSIREGFIQEDYLKRNEQPQGKVKLEDFALEFAKVYNN